MTTTAKFHVGLNVSDVAKSTDFYKTLFESEPLKQYDDYAKFETDSVVLSLIKQKAGAQPQFGHFGIRVNTELELNRHYARMNASDQPLLLEGKTDCCYAIQDKFWVKDPDGYDWEFYNFISDTTENAKKKVMANSEEEACCAPGCCS